MKISESLNESLKEAISADPSEQQWANSWTHESTQNGVTTFPFGTCSAIGKTAFLSQRRRLGAAGGDGHSTGKGSRLLAALLSRQ